MKRILLISCNTTVEPYPVYPLGATLIANTLRRAGYDCRFWDHLFHEGNMDALAHEITEFRPEAICLSLRNIDNASWAGTEYYVPAYKKMTSDIKSLTDAPVILGGSAFTLFPQRLLDETGADYGIAGEGEEAVLACLEDLAAGRVSENPVYGGRNCLTGAEMGSREREGDLAAYYLSDGGMLNLQSKRGCPHSCVYCSYPLLEGNRYRCRTPEDIVDEIIHLRDNYGMDFYMITDSVFNDSEGHYLAIAEELVRRNVTVPWTCYLRPSEFTTDTVRLLKRAGLHSVEWGTDAASDTTLKAMGKGFRWDAARKANDLFQNEGIYGSHFILFGGPEETEATVREGIENIMALQNAVVFAGIGIRVFPGTAMEKIAVKDGVIAPGTDLFPPVFYLSPRVEPSFIDSLLAEAFAGRDDRVYNAGDMTRRVLAMHRLGYRGPVWEYLLENAPTRRRRRSR